MIKSPQPAVVVQFKPLDPYTGQIYGKTVVLKTYTDSELSSMVENTFHPYILKKIIGCESQGQNIAKMDSNKKMSYGILQFNGIETWDTYAPLAGVTGTPMNPAGAIKVADYMISIGLLHRWSCATITKLL